MYEMYVYHIEPLRVVLQSGYLICLIFGEKWNVLQFHNMLSFVLLISHILVK